MFTQLHSREGKKHQVNDDEAGRYATIRFFEDVAVGIYEDIYQFAEGRQRDQQDVPDNPRQPSHGRLCYLRFIRDKTRNRVSWKHRA